ncbi:MAG TPA: sialidase family protein [Candidatus Sulfotelmatobacter sp.]|nr:sialidase family protein [Candidatus Sulfotelmatobacter sp.]
MFRRSGSFMCLFVLCFAPAASSQSTKSAEASPARTYPDFALQPPPINTSPGPEYASWTRMYQGIPGIERTARGRLWAAWDAGDVDEGPMNYVAVVTSSDDGKNWSEPKLVIDPPGNVHAWLPCLWIDPQGRLWLFWSQDYGGWDGRGGVWAIISDNPDSENPRWSAPRRLADGRAINKPTILTTGEWLLPVAVRPDECNLADVNKDYKLGLSPSVVKVLCHDLGDQKGTSVYASGDKGETWRFLGQARVQDTNVGEHMIVERRDGSLWMLVRTEYGIGQSISRDRGKSWGESGPSGIRNAVSRFFIRRLKSGKLLMVRHNPPDIWTRSLLTAYLSDDDGKTWYGGLVLDERKGVSYPDGVEAGNGKIYVIYDRGRSTDREILMATFTEEDIKQGKCVTDQCQLKMIVNKAGG